MRHLSLIVLASVTVTLGAAAHNEHQERTTISRDNTVNTRQVTPPEAVRPTPQVLRPQVRPSPTITDVRPIRPTLNPDVLRTINTSPSEDGVVLIDLKFNNGEWSAGLRDILPCGSPSKPPHFGAPQSAIFLSGDGTRPVAQRLITNPRLPMIEDPREPPKLLEEVSFTVAVPYGKGARSVTFIEDFDGQFKRADDTKAGINLDISERAARFETRPPGERPDCVPVYPRFGRTTGLVTPDVKNLSSAEVLSNRSQLIRQGTRAGVTPSAVRAFVRRYRGQLIERGFKSEDIDRLVRDYETAYSRSR